MSRASVSVTGCGYRHGQPALSAALLTAIAGTLTVGLVPGTGVEAVAQPAQVAQPPAPDFASPLAEPVMRADAELRAQKVTAWEADGTRYLLLENDVRFALGAYGFEADRAVVRILTEPKPGQPVRRLALYLDGARPLRGKGPVSAQADRLLVTAATTGEVALETDLMQPREAAPAEPIIADAARRFQGYDRALAQPTLPAPDRPLFGPEVDQRRQARRAVIEGRLRTERAALPPEVGEREAPAVAEAPPEAPTTAPAPEAEAAPETEVAEAPEPPAAEAVLPTRGLVSYGADRVVFDPAEEGQEGALMLIGDVRLIYRDTTQRPERVVSLQAERAVVFLDEARDDAEDEPADAAMSQELGAGEVRGVYLEDNVIATDGDYTIRAPRVYYDVGRNQAIVLEGVAYTWDVQRQIPLYLRARVLRQTARASFEAQDALVTTSSFAEPHFAIGAGRVTVREVTDAEGDTEQRFTARDMTFQAGGVPVFYWPYLAGQTDEIPLRNVGIGSSHNGLEVITTWDLFALTGQDRPEGVDATLALDYRGDHGPATGIGLEYERERMFGELNSYLLPLDNGTDDIGRRADVEHDEDTRGFARWQHRQYLQNDWELSLEGAYVSDETFLEEFFDDEAYEAKPYETSLYLKKQRDDWAFDLLATGQLNDFTPQLTTLQAPGYSVEKLPELGYYRIGTNLLDGRLSWFSENRLSRVRIDVGEDTPADRGFRNSAALELFGHPATTSFEDAADAIGLPQDWRTRLDTRQELTAPMSAGPVDVTPYVVGRVTAYDEDFDDYRGEEDPVRFWGAVGTRFSTQFHRAYPGVESALFDVHRLRHIIEPSVNVFLMGASLESEDLPVYDPQVEGLAEGAGVRLGLLNTLQTQRGGPGRWRSVDWLTLQTDLILRSDDADTETHIPRFYDYRPEFSLGGDHFYTRLLWMVSDTLGVTGELTHSLEHHQVAQWRIGATLQHTPRLASFANYQEIDILDSRLLTYGFTYQLTTKYTLSFAHRLDFGGNDNRSINVWLERRLPRWRLRFVASYDEIDDEQTIGVVLSPEGFSDLGSPMSFLGGR